MSYQPGKHLIATLHTSNSDTLRKYQSCKELMNILIEKYQLKKLGEVYHNFSPAGFTAVICLSESHISLHTWPEHKIVNLDVYLSNFKRSNDETVINLFEAMQKYFQAEIVQQQIITR